MRFTFRRVQTVTINLLDEGEVWDDGEPVTYPEGQETAALEWAEQAFLDEDYCEEFMEAETTPWERVK
jgi:hypothetical protein